MWGPSAHRVGSGGTRLRAPDILVGRWATDGQARPVRRRLERDGAGRLPPGRRHARRYTGHGWQRVGGRLGPACPRSPGAWRRRCRRSQRQPPERLSSYHAGSTGAASPPHMFLQRDAALVLANVLLRPYGPAGRGGEAAPRIVEHPLRVAHEPPLCGIPTPPGSAAAAISRRPVLYGSMPHAPGVAVSGGWRPLCVLARPRCPR